MHPLTEFFARHIFAVYFFYGLSFFTMGLAVLLEAYHTSELDFSQALRPLAGFGLVHGGHEWLEMFLLVAPTNGAGALPGWVSPIRLLLLSSSFLMLVAFGARLLIGPTKPRYRWAMLGLAMAVWLVGLAGVVNTLPPGLARWTAADVYTRYALAIPGAGLTVWGLVLQRRKFIAMDMPRFGNDVIVAAIAFGLYGGIGQLFASSSSIFPSATLNDDTFMQWFGFPIQVFRALMAMIAAVSIIRSLRAFQVEARRRMEELRTAQRAERQRLETTRAELLHRTVVAQESERQRIARELHDETGQTLTALSMGLRGLSETIPANPERAVQQARRLEGLAMDGIQGLQRLVGGLHPPQLDDFGLLAALRWYAGEIKRNFGLPVRVTVTGQPLELSAEQRVVLFRIAQEAITNAVRHAQAENVDIGLTFRPGQLQMLVQDNGQGFDVGNVLNASPTRPCWGLLGIQERAALIGAVCQISSTPGQGARVQVTLTQETPNHG